MRPAPSDRAEQAAKLKAMYGTRPNPTAAATQRAETPAPPQVGREPTLSELAARFRTPAAVCTVEMWAYLEAMRQEYEREKPQCTIASLI
jgi:hypothetical protein